MYIIVPEYFQHISIVHDDFVVILRIMDMEKADS